MDLVTPRIDILEDGATYGKFVVEPLEQGFGYTIGNAIRRVLLSSIPGAAVTSIKIDGVMHEFSTIPGVKEDTTELILNLRELYIRMDDTVGLDGEPPVVTIDVHGPGEVTGADIQVPAGIEVANPELHIATLNDETTAMRAEMTVERGKGYVLAEKQDRVKKVIGVIPLAGVFTPVQKVSYTVTPTRVGHKTDFDRLVLEVTTNGTVRPSDAVSESAKILDRQLRLFFDFAGESSGGIWASEEFAGAGTSAPDARIEELDFSVRTYNCLKKANILTVKELVVLSEDDLMNIRNFGKKSLTEVREKLEAMHLSLKPLAPGSSPRIQPQGDDDDEDDMMDNDSDEIRDEEVDSDELEAETTESADEE